MDVPATLRKPLFALICWICAADGTQAAEWKKAPSGRPSETRPFSMGFAYQPYDWSGEAFRETARFIGTNGDIIGFFFDAMIPWPEAASGAAYHPNQEAEIARRLAAIRPAHQVLVSTSLLGGDRTSLSGYLGATDLPLPGDWKGRTFDHPEVISAYIVWCLDLIDRFRPDYFVYVMEVDAAFTDVADPRFQSLLRSIKAIYPALKIAHPDLPVMIEFMLLNDAEMAKRRDIRQALLPYTDIFGVSTYPFLHSGGDPADIPADWFSRVRKFAPGKPFAIVETNHLAEDFLHPRLGVAMPGRDGKVLIRGEEAWQAAYLDLLFSEARKLDARFVIQWTSRDLDRLFERLRGTGSAMDPEVEPMNMLATDSGLVDESGRKRPAFDVWKRWLQLPLAPNPE